jgi:ribose-phosphate pyrophosphokinase
MQTAGADRLLVVDLHSSQIQGFFDGPFDHLFGIPTLARQWREIYGMEENFVVVSPDAGGVERARAFAKRIKAPIAIIDKRRSGPNQAKAFNVIGDVSGLDAIIVDDMIDTAGTLTQAVDSLIENGAKRVFAVATHPVFSGPAVERINKSQLAEVWVTNTMPLSQEAQQSEKIKVVSIAHVVAEAIKRINDYNSVSELFE